MIDADKNTPLEDPLAPVDTETEFTGQEWCLNSGDKLARALRILPSEHKVITSKLREKLDDTRYHINKFAHQHGPITTSD